MRIDTNNNSISFNKDTNNTIDKALLEEIERRLENIDINDKVEYSNKIPTDEDIVIWINPDENPGQEFLIRINDSTVASNTVWSSEKVNGMISDILIQADTHIHLNKEAIDLITKKDIEKWNNKSDFNGSYKALTDKPYIPSIEGLASEEYVTNAIDDIEIPIVPTKISELENDSGYAKSTDLHEHNNKSVLDIITLEQVEKWNSNTSFDGDYNSLTNKPTIPSIEGLASEEYVTNAIDGIDFTNYATKEEIPIKLSELENDKGYLIDIPTEYVTEEELNDKGYVTEEYVSSQINESIDKIDTTISSDTEPTDENVVLWVNTSQDENTESIARINDNTVANNTTWSSNKINEVIRSLRLVKEGNMVKLMLGDVELSNILIE